MGQVAIISNPTSTLNKRRIDDIRALLERSSNAFHFELGEVGSVATALTEINRIKPALLVVNGGDGTVQAVLTAIVNDDPFDEVPPIAVLPSGQTNMIADDLGAPKRPVRVLSRLLELARRGALEEYIFPRHLVGMNLGDGKPTIYGGFFGAASIVPGIMYTRKNVYPMRMPHYFSHNLAIIALCLAAFRRQKEGDPLYTEGTVVNVAGGGIFRGKFHIVIISSLEQVILGLKPWGTQGKGGLKFSCVEQTKTGLINGLRGLLFGSYGNKFMNGIHVRRSDKITVEGKDCVTLDGEIFDPLPNTPITLTGDKKLNFISLRGE